MRSQLLGVVVLMLLAPSVAHGAKPLRVSLEVTVRNAVIEIRGSGFTGKRSLARIGGRKATVRSGTRTRLHVVVPLKLRPGRHAVRVGRLRGSLRLVKSPPRHAGLSEVGDTGLEVGARRAIWLY